MALVSASMALVYASMAFVSANMALVPASMAFVDEIAKKSKKELRNHIQKEKKKWQLLTITFREMTTMFVPRG